MITAANICRHELVGLEACVSGSKNPSQVGIAGTIVGETMQMISLRCEGRILHVAKNTATFDLRLPDDTRIRVDGSVLVMRPEKRTSMRIKI